MPTSNNMFNWTFPSTVPPTTAMRQPTWYWVLTWIIAVVAIIGNGLVIYLIVTRQRLHITNNYFILSLAIADACTGLFIIPAAFVCSLDGFMCDRYMAYAVFNTFLFASVANVCAMTLDRYISIVIPLKYFIYMSTPRVIGVLCLTWIVPLIIAFTPLTWAYADREIRQAANEIFDPIQIIVSVVLPIVLMLMVYARIFIIARKISKQTRQTENQLRYNDANANSASPAHVTKKERRERRNREGAVAVIGAVIILFALCWVVAVYNSMCEVFRVCQLKYMSILTAQFLLHLNSTINPIVYAILKKDIRGELKVLIRGRTRRQDRSFDSQKTSSYSTAMTTNLDLK